MIVNRRIQEQYQQFYGFAFLASVIANCAPFKKGSKKYKPEDFIQAPEQIKKTGSKFGQLDECVKDAKNKGLKQPKYVSERIQ